MTRSTGQKLAAHVAAGRGWLVRLWYDPPWGWRDRVGVGRVRLGSLRRVRPISGNFGVERGQPIDRYYIEGFLAQQAADIRGRVLEVAEDTYTWRYGGERVTHREVLHLEAGQAGVTLVGDLTWAPHIAADSFDCVILTQTLHLIYEVGAAVRTIYRILKPGGVLLATIPGISQVEWIDRWHWRFTLHSARQAFTEVFGEENVWVEARGNVLAAAAFLYGLAAQELQPEELNYRDANYEVSIMVRAVKLQA